MSTDNIVSDVLDRTPLARTPLARPSVAESPRLALRSLHLTPQSVSPLRSADTGEPAMMPMMSMAAMPAESSATPLMLRAPAANAMMEIAMAEVAMAPPPAASPILDPTAAPMLEPTLAPMAETVGPAAADTPPNNPAAPSTSVGLPADPKSLTAVEPANGGSSVQKDEGTDKYDVVHLFYATDRAAIPAMAMRPDPLFPLLAAGFAFGAYLMAYLFSTGSRSLFAYMGHLGVAMMIVVTCYVAIQWQRADELLLNDRVVYGNERSPQGQVDLGKCRVTVPKTHQIGVVESPSLLRMEVRHDKERHMVLDRVDRLQRDDFYTELNTAIRAAEIPEVFVFIHGYNVEFDDAALRTAQLAFDLRYRGTPICYSWPSQGGLLKYTVDETNVVWTTPHLKQFLLDIVRHSGAEAVNLVAHSMGNRALTATLRELHLELQADARLFKNVVLAAPDVDAEVFRQMAPSMIQTARQVTLYASSNDNALIASKKVHGYPRAGESGDHLVIVPGIETIDVTSQDTSLLGHSYYGSSDSVLSDLYHLVIQSLPARERRWLEPRSMDGLTYWVFHRRAATESIGPDAVPSLAPIARQPSPVLDR